MVVWLGGAGERSERRDTGNADRARPIGSVGKAARLLRMNCPRVSLTVREEMVATLLTATVWSVLSRPAEALTAFSAPAPRELLLWTSYRL